MGCGSEDFGLKMTHLCHAWLKIFAAQIVFSPHITSRHFLFLWLELKTYLGAGSGWGTQ
jgi:hypothetical protein